MAQILTSKQGWRQELIAMKTSSGQLFLLLAVEKTPCAICRYGTRFETAWGSLSRQLNRITWCSSCFNAECEPMELDEGLRPAWSTVVRQAAATPDVRCWSGARPAVEELERRGLV